MRRSGGISRKNVLKNHEALLAYLSTSLEGDFSPAVLPRTLNKFREISVEFQNLEVKRNTSKKTTATSDISNSTKLI